MLPLLLLAGLVLEPVPHDEPVLAARVADIDADGHEDVVAVTAKDLLLYKRGKGPAIKRPAAPLTIVGRGLLAVVRDGKVHRITDPFGEAVESAAGPASLLAILGKTKPALLQSPGDLDGDGRDDPLLCAPDGFHTPKGIVPVIPAARLEIKRNDAFAVEYGIPAAVVGSWTGKGRQLAFFHEGSVLAFDGKKEIERIALPLSSGKEAAAIRRNEVFIEDIDGDGRLDLLLVVARGKTELFAKFEAVARLFSGGRVYNHEKKGFYRPVSFVKVAGLLLRSDLVDVDGDGDLDLVMTTVTTSLASTVRTAATGKAPGTYYVFRHDDKGFARKPAWTYDSPIPLSAFTDKPEAPVRFLPDYDEDGRPAGVVIGGDGVRLIHSRRGTFADGVRVAVKGAQPPAIGRQRAAVAHAGGVVIVEAKR